jgi:copper chaperone CopZ
LEAIPGVEKAKVSLEKSEAKIKHAADVSLQTLKQAITEAGFTAN